MRAVILGVGACILCIGILGFDGDNLVIPAITIIFGILTIATGVL